MKPTIVSSLFALGALATSSPTAAAADASFPGVTTSSGVSTVLEAKDLAPGSKVWAVWTSMPPGKKAVVPGANVFKWAFLGTGLSGSSVSQGNALPGQCFNFNLSEYYDLPAGQEIVNGPGDTQACNYGYPTPYWEENRGPDPYVFAYISVGGPGGEGSGDVDTGQIYWNLGSEVYGRDVTSDQFASVLKEINDAGAMTLAIRKVTIPAGARMVVTDQFPALRMVTTGKLAWGTLPAGADTSAEPAPMLNAFRSGDRGWIGWHPTSPLVLHNKTTEVADFIEWSVAPAE